MDISVNKSSLLIERFLLQLDDKKYARFGCNKGSDGAHASRLAAVLRHHCMLDFVSRITLELTRGSSTPLR